MAQTITVLGIDIAKLVFHVVGMDDSGQVVLRKRLTRSGLLTFIANIPPLRIGMEAYGSVHDCARRFREHGRGARTTLRWVETKPDDRSPWLKALIARRGKNRAAVALANKNARMVWGLLVHRQEYHVRTAA
jgi:transposase